LPVRATFRHRISTPFAAISRCGFTERAKPRKHFGEISAEDGMTTDDPVLWRGMTRTALDAAYNNSAAVPNSAEKVAEWTARSAKFRESHPSLLDLAYGPRARNRVDIFRCGQADAPLLAYIHGGYWQRNSKDMYSCLAEGPLARGFDVAMIGYTLAPDVTLAEIVAETHAAMRWLRSDGKRHNIGQGRLIVSGWSAGGHLTAMAMPLPEVDAGLAISGVFDVEPCRLNYLNEKLQLRAQDVRDVSPIHNIPAVKAPLTVAYGTKELPELQRQSRDYHAAWMNAGNRGALLAIDHDHFSILEELASPTGAITHAAGELLTALR
jgi:arylformamidase